jgi:hypothetical protein
MEKNNKINASEAAGNWIESIEPMPEISVSPFFKENLFARINDHDLSRHTGHEMFFFRLAVASIFLLLVINFSFIYKSYSTSAVGTGDMEQLVTEYENIDNDTYSNYSLLAVESNGTTGVENGK